MAGATDVQRRTSVFIVGGGPVGLAMGLLLDRFGIDCVVVEKSPTTTDHPKSRGCWVRTMEIFRQWGIEQAIRDRGLQDNSDIKAAQSPGRLVETSGLKTKVTQDDNSHKISTAHHDHAARHECGAEL